MACAIVANNITGDRNTMSFSSYQDFIDQFCSHAGLPDPQALYHGAAFRVGETDFMMRHGGKRAPDMIIVYCGLGSLPPPEVREAALLQLLESNLVLFGSGSNPSYAFNPNNRTVLLSCAFWLGEASGLRMLDMLIRFDAIAREWRQTYFLKKKEAGAARRTAPATARNGLPPQFARLQAGAGRGA